MVAADRRALASSFDIDVMTKVSKSTMSLFQSSFTSVSDKDIRGVLNIESSKVQFGRDLVEAIDAGLFAATNKWHLVHHEQGLDISGFTREAMQARYSTIDLVRLLGAVCSSYHKVCALSEIAYSAISKLELGVMQHTVEHMVVRVLL